MKKILLVAVACVLSSAAFAQKVMTIEKNDGSKVEINTADVKEITFAEAQNDAFYEGTWKVKSFEYTPATIQSDAWYDMITNWTGFPEKNDADRITFTADGKIKTDLSSTLKNYFKAESNFKVTNMEVAIHMGNSIANVVKPTILELDNVNRYFSATETSEDKVAYLGVMPNADDEELLDVFIIDYESRSFAYPDFEEWMMYGETKPTATSGGMYILFTMEKVAATR